MKSLSRSLTLFAAILLAPAAAWADGATASASLSETSADVGQSVQYRLDVSGARGGDQPKTPQVDGLTITPAGRSTSMQMNGSLGGGMQITSTTSYSFNVESTRAGRFVIPGQQIDTGAGVVRVDPVAFTVTAGGSDAAVNDPGRAIFAQLKFDKTSAYVGEAVPVEIKAFFGSNVQFNIDPNASLSGEGFTAQKFTQPREDVQSSDGAKYRVMTYRSTIAGAKTGTLSVALADLQAIVRLPRTQQRRRQNFSNPFDNDPFFRDPFGANNDSITKQIKLRTEPQSLEIKSLPPGAPADFNGAIGQFTLEAEAEPRKVQAGDPVTVRLHVSGRGNFDRVAAPTISDDKGLHLYPPGAKFKADDDLGLSGTKTFDQAVVAQTGRQSLPFYHFSYLDPDTGKYVSLKTPPLTVTVEGSAAPPETPTPFPSSTPVAAASPTPAPVQKPRDILYIRTDASPAADFAPVYRRVGFWITQGAIGVLLALAMLLWWSRVRSRNDIARRNAESQRRQGELLKSLRTEGTPRGDFYSAATRLAQLKAGAAASEHLSLAEVCAAQRFDSKTTAAVEQIFHRHDELAYSGGAVALEPVPADERRGVLETLETIGR